MKNRMLIIIISVFILILAISVSTFFIMSKYVFSNSMEKNKLNEKIITYSPGKEFLTNLKDSGRYIKVTIDLEVADKKNLKPLEERTSEIRDTIISVLRNKTSEEIEGSEGQKKLKQEIIDSLNNMLGQKIIVNVYFNDFVVQ